VKDVEAKRLAAADIEESKRVEHVRDVDVITGCRRIAARKVPGICFLVRIFKLSMQFSDTTLHIHWDGNAKLNLSRGPMLFSERNRRNKSVDLPFGWRIKRR
jgi:hypothetical protein